MGLSPKPTNLNALKNWNDLDELLQANLKVQTKGKQPSATININHYEMSEDEIITEATKQGYTVTKENGPDFLTFR